MIAIDHVGLALAVLLCVGLPLALGLWGEALAGAGGLLVLLRARGPAW